MLERIKDKHQNKKIAILGSGETAPLYSGDCDICIAVNGALALSKPIDYFVAFDLRTIKKPFFSKKPEVTRLLGCNIASMCKVMYPATLGVPRRIYTGLTLLDNPISKPPLEPHVAWTMVRPKSLNDISLEFEHMYSADNVIIPAFQLSYLMGASEINIYGVGLHRHYYFDGHYDSSHEKPFGSLAPAVLNLLIQQAQDKGIIIRATKEKESKLQHVSWL